ncbi:30S ribosomal protein S15 [uncultured archaeon]|nr:30S ribosomal protein S15 [uncultured archaeon]
MVKSKKSEKKFEKPLWLKYTADEVKAIILKLGNKGISAEKIGLILRDQYGIPKVNLYGFKIKQVLEEKGKFEEPTTTNLKAKLNQIVEHYKKNKGDKKAERSLIITKAKLKKREEYQLKRE